MNILSICRHIQEREGEVGIEIEVEGNQLPDAVVGWRREEDGSLRGESCEYVLRRPCKREQVGEYLSRITKGYEDNSSYITESARQSIHIHINVQDMSLTEVYSFIVLFLIYETSLVNYCGGDRVGNLFCLRSSDAEYLLSSLEAAASPSRFHRLDTDQLRYSALNVVSLFKFGSLEFRSMRGTSNFEMVEKWVGLLLRLKDMAKQAHNPLSLVSEYRDIGVEAFTEKMLGEWAGVVTEQQGWQWNTKLGMRNIRAIAYSGDWEGLSGEQAITQPSFSIPAESMFRAIEGESAGVRRERLLAALTATTTIQSFEEEEEEPEEEEENEEWQS